MIYRALAAGLLLTSSLWLTGCCCSRGCGPSLGCGRSYWGAYADNPPGCDPCDDCGNWTGGCGKCRKKCISFPWERLGRNRGCFLSRLGRGSSCCEPTCEPTCEQPCEQTCGEVTCGEVGCGSVGGTWSTPSEQSMDAAVTPPWRPSPMRQVSSTNLHGGHTAPCNCQK